MKAFAVVAAFVVLAVPHAQAATNAPCAGQVAVCDGQSAAGFALIAGGKPATVYVDADAETPVTRVAGDFASDLDKVSGATPSVVHDLTGVTGDVVVIGEIGHSKLLNSWIKAGLVKTDPSGQWEAYSQQVVDHPVPGIAKALVILGSDKRGAIYGAYDISARMGVSPWYWWADVPVAHKTDVYITAGERHDQPAVKYRGFFINDEDPSFGGWAREKYGGVNHDVYARVFELDLRLKGNYLWPAMWGRSIADDDPQSLKTADDYGIVLGTSHHEPMTRAQVEWHRHTDQGVTGGAWDYTTNAENLRTFWRGGIERMVAGQHENVVTVGMRGDGDKPMAEGTATQLLENIVADQRSIIADVTGKPADQTPQVWALYKEVQDYYDHGMKVPDDVTLLFSDDNWGQIRRLPDVSAPPRAGGYGVYYHFDYVGGPRNYKWINTNQIEKTWQQMDLAYESGADRLWIVNVGDIKPMEYPLSFFMDMAWNPKAMTPEALHAYPAQWARQQFPEQIEPSYAELGQLLEDYSRIAAWRKPELLDQTSFSLDNYDDFAHAEAEAGGLAAAAGIARQYNVSPAQHDAFDELVGYEANALGNLYQLYFAAAQNQRLAAAGKIAANGEADAVKRAFAHDSDLAAGYNRINGGKWNHMMDQTHIGYTGWQQPATNMMPLVATVPENSPPASMGTPLSPRIGGDAGLPPPPPAPAGIYDEADNYIAIEAEHYARKVDGPNVHWLTIPDLGRTLSSVISYPQAAPATTDNSVHLDYDIMTSHETDATLNLYLAPTLDTAGKGGLRLAVAMDDGPPQTLTFDLKPDTPAWNKAVEDNIVILQAPFKALKAGRHTIKVFRIDGNVVLERLVLDTGGLKPSYLGPPESRTISQEQP